MSAVESSFEPHDFSLHDTTEVNIINGRGKKLEEFPSVVASMEKHTTEEVVFAHKFLFGNKGSSLKKKELLQNLGEFSGYLKMAPKGYDKDKLEKDDEREEVRILWCRGNLGMHTRLCALSFLTEWFSV